MTVSLTLLDRPDDEGRSLFMLNEPYVYRIGPNCRVVVPANYVTNFGTIPRWFAWIVSPAQLREAAIVHDYMCNETFTPKDAGMNSGYSRWLADAVLYEAMARMGFGWVKRTLVYAGVRMWAIVTDQTWPESPEKLVTNTESVNDPVA